MFINSKAVCTLQSDRDEFSGLGYWVYLCVSSNRMTDLKNDYYVYVYIDPRNFEEFYYGKGTGSRKKVHLADDSDTEKAKRIKAIKAAGLNAIIKVIAKDLTEQEAFLIEKTLIWKLGKSLTRTLC